MKDSEQAVRVAIEEAELPVSEEEIDELVRLYPALRQMAKRIRGLADADDSAADLVFRLERPQRGEFGSTSMDPAPGH